MPKDVIIDTLNERNPNCEMANGESKLYSSIPLNSEVLIKEFNDTGFVFVKGTVLEYKMSRKTWIYKVETKKYTGWYYPADFKHSVIVVKPVIVPPPLPSKKFNTPYVALNDFTLGKHKFPNAPSTHGDTIRISGVAPIQYGKPYEDEIKINDPVWVLNPTTKQHQRGIVTGKEFDGHEVIDHKLETVWLYQVVFENNHSIWTSELYRAK